MAKRTSAPAPRPRARATPAPAAAPAAAPAVVARVGPCPRCGGINPDPHLHERTGRPCIGPDGWPSHLDEHGNPKKG